MMMLELDEKIDKRLEVEDAIEDKEQAKEVLNLIADYLNEDHIELTKIRGEHSMIDMDEVKEAMDTEIVASVKDHGHRLILSLRAIDKLFDFYNWELRADKFKKDVLNSKAHYNGTRCYRYGINFYKPTEDDSYGFIVMAKHSYSQVTGELEELTKTELFIEDLRYKS